jgi:hypothetical protein
MDLSTYDDAAAWADTIVEVTQNRTMPPWHATDEHAKFSNDRRLSDKELDLLERWVAQGKRRGDPSLDAHPIAYNSDWHLPKTPDIVIPMSDKPYSVPRSGVVNYQYFRADMNNDKELWVKGMEIIPGAREVLHHVLVGRGPHSGATLIATLTQAWESKPPQFPDSVPEELADICRKALARDASTRVRASVHERVRVHVHVCTCRVGICSRACLRSRTLC